MTPSQIKIPHRFSTACYWHIPRAEPSNLCVNLGTQGKNWQLGKILTLKAKIGILGKSGHSQLKIGTLGEYMFSVQKSAFWSHLLQYCYELASIN